MYKVYIISNTVNQKRYVGMTSRTLNKRFHQHCNSHSTSTLLIREVLEFGKNKFKIELISEHVDLLDAMIIELQTIKEFETQAPTGYNTLYSEGTKKRISESLLNRPCPDETKMKISSSLRGHIQSEETIQRRINHLYKPLVDNFGNEYPSCKAASLATGIPEGSIIRLIKGQVIRTKHKYTFKYKV